MTKNQELGSTRSVYSCISKPQILSTASKDKQAVRSSLRANGFSRAYRSSKPSWNINLRLFTPKTGAWLHDFPLFGLILPAAFILGLMGARLSPPDRISSDFKIDVELNTTRAHPIMLFSLTASLKINLTHKIVEDSR